MNVTSSYDVAIIGAGPAGTVAAANLARRGYRVAVLEREIFPRFSIGESLLPQCMAFLEEAGMLEALAAAHFQPKTGAAFLKDSRWADFDFFDKFTPGHATTYQVQRARFDKILADEAEAVGAEVHYGQEIIAVEMTNDGTVLTYTGDDGTARELRALFCLDASGFGRVLPRLLGLDRPSELPVRESIFTHVVDRIDDATFDRDKILITIHQDHPRTWFWLIPFSDGTSSLGVVGEQGFFDRYGDDDGAILRAVVAEVGALQSLLRRSEYHQPVGHITGYSTNVSALHGRNFALLGNAGEFLDPVFSSGVTIALKSASLATEVLNRQLSGQPVDWQRDYAAPLSRGVETFRQFVAAWYDGSLHDIIFATNVDPNVRRMICAVLAGYAWDETNPFVARPKRRLPVLAEVCRSL